MPYEDDGYDADDRPPLPAGQAHPRVAAGLEGLCSPSLKHKILPWLGAVRDGGDGESESGISDFSKGQAHSLGLESELPGAKKTSRSVHSAPLLSRIVADPVHSPPSLRPAGLGSPIKFPVLPQTPARRVVSTSAGTHDDGRLHGQTTGNGGAYDGATPPSGTIPSAFFIPSLGSPVPVKSSTPSDESIKHSQARIRSHSGSKAPNVVQDADSASVTTDTSFGNPHHFTPTQPLPNLKRMTDGHAIPRTALSTARAASTTGWVGGQPQTSSVPFGKWGAAPASKVKHGPDEELVQAQAGSRILHPSHSTRPAVPNGGSPRQPSHASPTRPSLFERRLSTPTITPESQHTTPTSAAAVAAAHAPFDWKASMFQDRVLCELLEFLGKPALEDETRTMLMDLLAHRLSALHASTPAQDSPDSPKTSTEMRARRLLTVIWPSPFSSADAVPSLSSQSLPPTWAADLQKEVALLRRELHAKHAPSTTPSLPSTAPADARCFLSSPGDLLFQEHGPLAFAVPDHLGSFGGTAPLHGKSALPAVFPPARVETLSSTHDASGPSSLKINVQPPSTTVNSQQRAKKQRAAQRQQQSPPAAESSTSDLVSAVTAATSPAGFATGDPPTAVVALDSYRSLRDLIERSLPPTPPSESGSLLGAHALPPAAPAPGAQSAAGSPPPRPPTVASTILSDPSYPRLPDPRPWDLLTARLYSWAIFWEEASFTTTLEDMSLDKQVNSFALTIWTTLTFKRALRNKLCANPHEPFERMFVPPSFSDLLNKAVHHQNYKDARELLAGLWSPFGLDQLSVGGAPRVIVALARHRNADDAWAVHRFDLATATLTTWLFSAEEQRLKDERPLRWWRAIQEAWPAASVKDSGDVHQKIQHVVLAGEDRNNVSLFAVNCFRNVLLGWRWDREAEIPHLRECIWKEVRRLLKRKAEGALVFDPATDGGRVDDL